MSRSSKECGGANETLDMNSVRITTNSPTPSPPPPASREPSSQLVRLPTSSPSTLSQTSVPQTPNKPKQVTTTSSPCPEFKTSKSSPCLLPLLIIPRIRPPLPTPYPPSRLSTSVPLKTGKLRSSARSSRAKRDAARALRKKHRIFSMRSVARCPRTGIRRVSSSRML